MAYDANLSSGISFDLVSNEAVEAANEYSKWSAVQFNQEEGISYDEDAITKAVTNGLKSGKSMQGIADEISATVEGISETSALRAAVTATTTASNAGKYQRIKKLAEDSYSEELKHPKKSWSAILDLNTRASHAAIDGEMADLDERFSNGLLYPGDTTGGTASEIYNCRCTFNRVTAYDTDYRDGFEDETYVTYNDWLESQVQDSATHDAAVAQQERIASYLQQQSENLIAAGDYSPKTENAFDLFYVDDIERYNELNSIYSSSAVVSSADHNKVISLETRKSDAYDTYKEASRYYKNYQNALKNGDEKAAQTALQQLKRRGYDTSSDLYSQYQDKVNALEAQRATTAFSSGDTPLWYEMKKDTYRDETAEDLFTIWAQSDSKIYGSTSTVKNGADLWDITVTEMMDDIDDVWIEDALYKDDWLSIKDVDDAVITSYTNGSGHINNPIYSGKINKAQQEEIDRLSECISASSFLDDVSSSTITTSSGITLGAADSDSILIRREVTSDTIIGMMKAQYSNLPDIAEADYDSIWDALNSKAVKKLKNLGFSSTHINVGTKVVDFGESSLYIEVPRENGNAALASSYLTGANATDKSQWEFLSAFGTSECEIILNKNAEFEILGVKRHDDHFAIYCRLISSG